MLAWLILLVTMLGREAPACGPVVLFAGYEPGLLADHASQSGLGTPADLGAALQLPAHLGGYRDRQASTTRIPAARSCGMAIAP